MHPTSDYLAWNVQIMTPKYLQKEISQTIFQVSVFTTKIHYAHPKTHSFMPEPRLQVVFTMAKKKETEKHQKQQKLSTKRQQSQKFQEC